MITTYEEAVEKISTAARSKHIRYKSPKSGLKRSNSDSELPSLSPIKDKKSNRKKIQF
jgi:hypothetical protein